MPESRFVSSKRLWPLLAYLTAAVLALLVADALVGALANARRWRTFLALAWVVLLPVGGWLVWRRT